MSLDPQAAAYLEDLRASGSTLDGEISVEDARRLIEAGTATIVGAVDEVSAVEDRTIQGLGGEISIRIYRPLGAEDGSPVLVYFHGGGWVIGSLDTHDGICRALSRRTPCVVVSVGYRLAPEHTFPAAVEDAWAATRWVIENGKACGTDPTRVAVAGDSAGGNLAAVTALRARAQQVRLALQVLIYPITDHNLGTQSYLDYADGYNLTREAMGRWWRNYLRSPTDGTATEASPLRAPDLTGVAPALVVTAEYDPLRDEGEAYAKRLTESRVPTVMIRYDGMIHGFVRMTAVIDRANDALDEIARNVRYRFSAPIHGATRADAHHD